MRLDFGAATEPLGYESRFCLSTPKVVSRHAHRQKGRVEGPEREVAQPKLAARLVERFQRLGGAVRAPFKQIEKGRRLLRTETTGFAKRDQRIFAFVEWPAPPVERQPAPIRLELNLRETFDERPSVDRVPTRLVERAHRERWRDDRALVHRTIPVQDFSHASNNTDLVIALRLPRAITEDVCEVLDGASPHRLEGNRSVLLDQRCSRAMDRSLALVVLDCVIRWVGFRSPMIEEQRPQRACFLGVGGFLRQRLVESDRVRDGGTVQNQARHLPGIDRLRDCQHRANQAGGKDPRDQLETRLGHVPWTLPWWEQLTSFRCLLGFGNIMRISVHFYAAAKELAGCESSTFEFPQQSVPQAELRVAVTDRFPSLAAFLARMRLAVNGDFVDATELLHDDDRVDVLPPVAGGSPVVRCSITEHEISLDEVRKAVQHSGAGGVCIFHGVVRDNADGNQVSRLDYEAHESLALKEMKRVLEGVAAEHDGVRIAAAHRVGRLDIGDVAVCVAASAAHRDDAFTACRKAIDRIKETVPLWKKEWGPDGEAYWVNLDA